MPLPSPHFNVTPWMPQPGPQSTAIQRHLVTELFYGGAVAGGKSDFLLGDFAQDVPQEWGPAWHGILFRRSYSELEDMIARSQQIYPPWFGLDASAWVKSENTWRWPNGATLKMRYLESSTDWMRYWGHAYTWIGWDELPTWPDLSAYVKLKARLRSAHPVPNKRIRATGNPGGPGHNAVKQYFRIDEYPNGGQIFETGGSTRLFIRSRLTDNQILLKNDPQYGERLKGLGSPELVRAWLEGDWGVIAGAFFPEFNYDKHVIAPFEIPAHWSRFRAMDWGSSRPFSVGWYAVSDGLVSHIPVGALVKYREWYGSTGEPNVGLKLTAEEVAEGIIERTAASELILYTALDPAGFAENGGPSIAERMSRAGVTCKPADNRRVAKLGALGGWDQLRARLKGEDTTPLLYFFDTCIHTIRTLPALQHDTLRPEDVDTEGEDHAGDETRYACMSRPWMRAQPSPKGPPRGAITIQEMVDRYQSTSEGRRGSI